MPAFGTLGPGFCAELRRGGHQGVPPPESHFLLTPLDPHKCQNVDCGQVSLIMFDTSHQIWGSMGAPWCAHGAQGADDDPTPF